MSYVVRRILHGMILPTHCLFFDAPDDILQLIFYELIDPAPFSLTCKRLHSFTQDPYVRANVSSCLHYHCHLLKIFQYFLNRYGRIQAMFHAFGRGKVLSERVLEVRVQVHTTPIRHLLTSLS